MAMLSTALVGPVNMAVPIERRVFQPLRLLGSRCITPPSSVALIAKSKVSIWQARVTSSGWTPR